MLLDTVLLCLLQVRAAGDLVALVTDDASGLPVEANGRAQFPRCRCWYQHPVTGSFGNNRR